jgi:type I restriction enzyme S subunit
MSYDLQYGTSEKSSLTGEIAVLRMGNINRDGGIDYSDLVYSSNPSDIAKFRLDTNDLLFNRTNSSEWVGKTAIYRGDVPAIYAGYLIRIKLLMVFPPYVNYVMNSTYHRRWCDSVKSDAVNQSNINANKLSELFIPIPPINEQIRIVNEVEQWLKHIEHIEYSNANLTSLISNAKSRILDLAIKGKLLFQDSKDEPAIEALRRINPSFQPCDNPHYQNKEMRVPKSWCYASFDSINTYRSKSVNPALSPGNTYELYSVPSFETGMPEFIEGKNIASTKGLVRQNDVLLCKINPHLNRSWVVTHHRDDLVCIASSEWIVFRNENLNPYYMRLCFSSPYFKELMMSNVSGVGGSLMRAQPIHVKKYIVPIPPIQEQQRIVVAVKSAFDLLDRIAIALGK